MGQTPQATVGTIYEVNKLGSEGDCVGKDTTQNPCSSFSFCGYTDAGWTTRPDGTS